MFFRKRKVFVCSVCGYNCLPSPLYSKTGIPDVRIMCACCGFQPGYDDVVLGYTLESYREDWLQNGAEWSMEIEKPKQWDLNKQLKNINIPC